MTTQIVNVPLEKIIYNKFQVADTVDQAKVEEICASLLQNRENGSKGLLQITRARNLEDGRYEQAFGRHRLIAFQQLAATDSFWAEMPLMVSEMTDIEMFELMGIENFHRRDISPIEEASIFNTYMTSFHKTSVEAAQKFGKTEEYVRGSIRLLNLPEKAQTWTSEGKLTKSAARDLLVAMKLGGESLVQEALNVIESEGDSFENAANCIEEAIRQNKEVTWLAADTEWAKAKKFPVKHLAPLTLINIQAIVGVDNAQLAAVKEMKKLIDAGMEVTNESYPQFQPDGLEKIRILANPPQCEQCPLHAVLDGSHYCGIKLCAERKKDAWKKHQAETVSKELGIPMYQKSDGDYFELNRYSDGHKKLFKKGSADLRLIPADYMYNNFEGVGDRLKVVVIGESAKKFKNSEATATVDGKKEEMSRELQRKITATQTEYVARFMWHVAAFEFASVLDGVTSLEYLKYHWDDATDMNHAGDYPSSVIGERDDESSLFQAALKLKKADALKELRRMIMFHAVYDRTPGGQLQAKKPVVQMAKDCQDLATKWDVKLPKDFMTQAEKYQAELDTALKEIKKEKPS